MPITTTSPTTNQLDPRIDHSDPSRRLSFGYEKAALEDAFNKVRNAKHWKDEVSATISESDFEITSAAVAFFTGSRLEVVKRLDDGQVRVWAAGYWATIGS